VREGGEDFIGEGGGHAAWTVTDRHEFYTRAVILGKKYIIKIKRTDTNIYLSRHDLVRDMVHAARPTQALGIRGVEVGWRGSHAGCTCTTPGWVYGSKSMREHQFRMGIRKSDL